MVEFEKYDSDQFNTAGDREKIKLEAGQRLRNCLVTGVSEGVSDFGAYTIFAITAEDGSLLSMLVGGNVFGTNAVRELTVGEEGSRAVKPAIIGKLIWIGKSNATLSKNKKNYYDFQWGFEEE